MGRQVVKQPDGLFAIWSSVVDNFIVKDATEKEIRDWWLADAIEGATDKAFKSLNDSFRLIRTQGTDNWGMTYEDCLETIREAEQDVDDER